MSNRNADPSLINSNVKRIQELEARLKDLDSPKDEIDLLAELAWELRTSQPEKSTETATRVTELAHRGEYSESPFVEGWAAGLVTLAFHQTHNNQLKQGAENALQALRMLEARQASKTMIRARLTLSWNLFFLGSYPAALEYALDALKELEQFDSDVDKAWIFDNLACVYGVSGDFTNALHYHKKAVDLFKELDDVDGLIRATNNLAMTLYEKKDYMPALETVFESLDLAERWGRKVDIFNINCTAAQITMEIGDLVKANQHLETATEIVKSLENPPIFYSYVLIETAKLALKIRDFPKAESKLLVALETAEQSGQKAEQAECHRSLTYIYEEQGNYQEALRHQKAFQALNEEVSGEQAATRMAVLSVTHQIEAAQKETEIYRLQAEQLSREIEDQRIQAGNQERYRIVADYTYDWGYWRAPDGAILYMSPSCARVTGYTADEFIENPGLLEEIVLPEDRPALDHHKQMALKDPLQSVLHKVDFRIRRRDGTIRWIGHICQTIWKDGHTNLGLRATNRDITERKQLEVLRSLMSATLDVLPVGVCLTDEDGYYRVMNGAYCAIYEYDREEMLGQHYSVIMPPDQITLANAHYARLLSGDVGIPIERKRQRKDGSIVYIEAINALVDDAEGKKLVITTVHDISERKQVEQLDRFRVELWEYAASHSLQELIQRALDEICALTNSPIGFYHFVEEDQKTLSLQAWSSRTQEEFCKAEGQGLHYDIEQAGVWVDAFHERKPVIHNDYAALPHRKGLPDGHAEVIRQLVVPVLREDRVVSILGIGNKPTDYDKNDAQLVSTIADLVWTIVSNKLSEAKLRQAQDQLAEQQRELAKSEERQRVARDLHDSVSQSIHSMVLFSETLAATLEKNDHERTKRILGRLQESARQSNKEMRLLLYELQTEGPGRSVNLVADLEERLAKVEHRAGVRAQVIQDGSLDYCPLEWHENLFWIATEALNNAIKHAQARKMQVLLRCSPQRLEMLISDDGLGFDTSKERVGSMGLNNMRARADIIGGTLMIESEPGQGTTVRFVAELEG